MQTNVKNHYDIIVNDKIYNVQVLEHEDLEAFVKTPEGESWTMPITQDSYGAIKKAIVNALNAEAVAETMELS